MAQTVLTTGGSRGIGYATAILFAEEVWNVIATMRDVTYSSAVHLASLSNVTVLPLDVTKGASIESAFYSVSQPLDVVVNNAGFELCGALEFVSDEQHSTQFETNVHSPIRVMQSALQTMRPRRNGVIINVTSVCGKVSLPFAGAYIGSKHAVEGILESAALELAPFGIRVRIVSPGCVRTKFSSPESMVVAESPNCHEYDGMMQSFVETISDMDKNGSDALQIAAVIDNAATEVGDQFRFIAGKDALQQLGLRKKMNDEGTLLQETNALLQQLGRNPNQQTVLVSATMPLALVKRSL